MSQQELSYQFGWGADKWIEILSGIERYDGVSMTHRPDLFTHVIKTREVGLHLGILVDYYDDDCRLDFDHFILPTALMFHDNEESITGDIPAPKKEAMSQSEKAQLQNEEAKAAECLAATLFPDAPEIAKIYIASQEELRKKESLIAQMVNAADKIDALCEKIHAIRCGDNHFLEMIERSRNHLLSFDNYPFWRLIKSNQTLDTNHLPSDEQLSALPKLTVDDLDTPKKFKDALFGESVSEWPSVYRTWLSLSFRYFDKNPEKYIFQGWYKELWQRWGYKPQEKVSFRVVNGNPILVRETVLSREESMVK